MIQLTDQQAALISGGSPLVAVNVPINTSVGVITQNANSLALNFGSGSASAANGLAGIIGTRQFIFNRS